MLGAPFLLKENICTRCCLCTALVPNGITSHYSSSGLLLKDSIIPLFQSLITSFRSLGSHHPHPRTGHKQELISMIGFSNWKQKYTKVTTILSSLCSFISSELQDKVVQKMVWSPSQNSQPAAYLLCHNTLHLSWKSTDSTKKQFVCTVSFCWKVLKKLF